MRAIAAFMLMALSFAVIGFVVAKWLPVVWKDGVSEAYDQLVSSTLNLISTGSLMAVGVISFIAGVLVAPQKSESSGSQ